MHGLEARIIEVYLLLFSCLCQNICKSGSLASRTLLLHGLLLLRIASRLNHCVARRPDGPCIALDSLVASRSTSRSRSSIYYTARLLAFRVGDGVHFQSETHVRAHRRWVTGLSRGFLTRWLVTPEQKVRRAATSNRLESRIFHFTRLGLFLHA